MQDRQKISIHALREEGDYRHHGRRSSGAISIHALREEGDAMAGGSRSSGRNFYPRPPRGGRLGAAAQIGEGKVDFYPRPPRGGRPGGGVLRVGINEFLSTPSARRATWRALARPTPTGYFYPRPPRGGRQRACRSLLKKSNFYPRPPRGGRPGRASQGQPRRSYFYPRPPRGGRPAHVSQSRRVR